MKKRLFLLTGSPSVGKTMVLMKTVEALKNMGYSVGGMVSCEVRSCGTRVGFEVLDLNSSKRGWLAHINQPGGARVGKYGVNLKDLESVGVEAIMEAIEECDVLAIDEVGPMELFSQKFREAVGKAIESGKLVVGVIHWKAKDRLIDEVKKREDAEIVNVTYENRDRLHETLVKRALDFLKNARN